MNLLPERMAQVEQTFLVDSHTEAQIQRLHVLVLCEELERVAVDRQALQTQLLQEASVLEQRVDGVDVDRAVCQVNVFDENDAEKNRQARMKT